MKYLLNLRAIAFTFEPGNFNFIIVHFCIIFKQTMINYYSFTMQIFTKIEALV